MPFCLFRIIVRGRGAVLHPAKALKQAGVVDSGGQGLLTVLKGWRAAFNGEKIEDTTANIGSAATFEFEGERLTYTASRDVDYQNEDLAVGVYYNDGAGFTAGTYRVEVYADGRLAGQSDIVLR